MRQWGHHGMPVFLGLENLGRNRRRKKAQKEEVEQLVKIVTIVNNEVCPNGIYSCVIV